MSQNDGLNRRSFLRNAGMTALVGAVGTGSSLAAAAGAAVAAAADGTKFDFDTPYNRIGTDSTKCDQPITRPTARTHRRSGMGIADMDFRAAPRDHQGADGAACSTRTGATSNGHAAKSFTEGIVAWNKKRYGVDINPEYRGDHHRRAPRHHRRAARRSRLPAARCC